MPTKNNILLRKRAVLKKVQLPDRKVFYAKCERMESVNLTPYVNVRRTYTRTIGARRPRRRRQRSRRIKTILKKEYNLGEKVSLGKILIREGLEYTPKLYEKRTKKIKIKRT